MFGFYIRFGVCTILIVWPASVFLGLGSLFNLTMGKPRLACLIMSRTLDAASGCNVFPVIRLLMYIKCSKLIFSIQWHHVTHSPRSTRIWMHMIVFNLYLPQIVRRTFNRRMIRLKVRRFPARHSSRISQDFSYSNLPGDPTSYQTISINFGPNLKFWENNRKCNDIWTKFGFEVGCQVVPTGVSGYEGERKSETNKKNETCFTATG